MVKIETVIHEQGNFTTTVEQRPRMRFDFSTQSDTRSGAKASKDDKDEARPSTASGT
jgi:hypothetical protein